MHTSKYKAGLYLFTAFLLSACGSVDPWDLLPSSERVFIQMTGNQTGSAEPITVEQLLARASDEGEEEPNSESDALAVGPVESSSANLHFTGTSGARDVELLDNHKSALGSLEITLASRDDASVIIEVPAFPPYARITAFRRAAAVARYFELKAYNVKIRPSPSLKADTLRVSLEQSI